MKIKLNSTYQQVTHQRMRQSRLMEAKKNEYDTPPHIHTYVRLSRVQSAHQKGTHALKTPENVC